MSNKAKIMLAVGIVAGILGLILIDVLSNKSQTKNPPVVANSEVAGGGDVIEGIRLSDNNKDKEKPADKVEDPKKNEQAKKPEQDKPTPQPTSPQPISMGESYEVQPNDSAWSIAKAKYGSGALMNVITQANPNVDFAHLRLGTKLTIPPKPAQVVKGATDTHKPETPKTEHHDTPAPTGKNTYTVAAGDSLWKIAAKHHPESVKEYIDEIIKANPDKLTSKDKALRVGWQLVLPD